MKLSSLLSLASFGLVALVSVSAEAQPFPMGLPRAMPGAYAPFRGPMHLRGMRRGAPVVYVTQPAPRPASVVVVTPPAPCHPTVVAPPPPSDEHGLLVLDSTPLVGGQAVLIEWGAGYYPGQVIAVNGNGTVRVHYTSYGGMWDEDVPRYRLRLAR
ncbi:MAG: hypothetical protein U0326_27960 [Polyangiales bacterium]